MATVQAAPPQNQRLFLDNITWPSYLRISKALDNRSGIRVTYDRGRLEIMVVSPQHERYKHLAGRLIDTLSDELDIEIAGFGSMTFRRPRKRGLEPDECYWIAHEAQVRGKTVIDLKVDPPPDLVVEIDITRSSVNRLGIYAALRVSEVWRFNGQALTFLELAVSGEYIPLADSKAFPGLKPADVLPFLLRCERDSEKTIVRAFRAWIRQNLASGGSPTP
jgi:Uma2 family endonuclease